VRREKEERGERKRTTWEERERERKREVNFLG